MSVEVTVAGLAEAHAETLGLRWVSGRERAGESLGSGAGREEPTGLVGHMNLERPNLVQVLGEAELGYLEALAPHQARVIVDALLSAHPACVVLAAAPPSPAIVTEAAARAGVPVLQCAAPSEQVVRELRDYLGPRVARRLSVHGVFLEVTGLGVLLTGQPGVGKSELALELLSRGHRLIADDAPEFSLVGPDTVEGTCPAALRQFMEVRGLGIVNVCEQFGDDAVRHACALRLVIRLEPMDVESIGPDERLDGIRRSTDILGVRVPEVTLPVAPGRNLSVLVECTVRNQLLLMRGYDAARDLADRQIRLMNLPGERA